MNPFELLEIAPSASDEEIKAAYHRQAKKWHPDRFSGPEKAEAESRFRSIADAFNQLKDPDRRRAHAAQAQAAPKKASAPQAAAPAPATPPPTERTADGWADMAREAMEHGDLDRAKGLIQYAIRMDGSKADYYIFLSDALERSGGDPRQSIRALETALKLRPNDVEAHLRMGDLFLAQGLQARSQHHFEKARQLDPKHKRFAAERAAARRSARAADQAPESQGLVDQFKSLLGRFTRKG